MTNTQPQTDVDGMVTLGVVELLISPEYSGVWLRELASGFGLELTEAQEEYLNDTVVRTLDQLALPFVESLPEDLRGTYRDLMEKRDLAFHPVREEQGVL